MPTPTQVKPRWPLLLLTLGALGCSTNTQATLQMPLSVASTSTWQNFPMSSLTSAFALEFDAIPSSNSIDALTSLSNAPASDANEGALVLQFAPSGTLQALNGASFAAIESIPYAAETNYHFRVSVDVVDRRYSAIVTPAGDVDHVLADQYAFATAHGSDTFLNDLGLESSAGSETLSNARLTLSIITHPEVTDAGVSPDAGSDGGSHAALGTVLSAAISRLAGDLQLGQSNPLSSLCAASSGVLCTRPGSVSTSSLHGDGVTDDTAALEAALSAGDVNLPGDRTYVIRGTVSMPSYRMLQCQPGATLEGAGALGLSDTMNSTVFGCAFDGVGVLVSAGGNHTFLGNTFSSSLTLTSGAAANVVVMNDFEGADAGLVASGAVDTMARLNRVDGVLSPAIPLPMLSGGTQLQQDLWAVLRVLQGSTTTASYQVIKPGAAFGGSTCHGDGTTDDTACFNAALAAGNALVAAGSYVLGTPDSTGSIVTLPPHRTLLCAEGATLLDPLTSTPSRMISLGWADTTSGDDAVIGCRLVGMNTVDNFANTYVELMEIANNGQPHDILVLGDSFEDSWGDGFITYSGCGTADAQGWQCGSGAIAPAQSGPANVSLLFSYLRHAQQPIVHLNGGQHLHVAFNRLQDGTDDDEQDTNVMQIVTSNWMHNFMYATTGAYDNLDDKVHSYAHGCSGRDGISADDTQCYSFNNVIDGTGGGHPMELDAFTATSNCGHYANELLADGGVMSGGGC